jgi:hypothetical protein
MRRGVRPPWAKLYQLSRTLAPCDMFVMSTTTLSAAELAKLLGETKRKIYGWVACGLLTCSRNLSKQLRFDPETVRRDYERAGIDLPAPMVAHLAGLKSTAKTAKPRAEVRGAA